MLNAFELFEPLNLSPHRSIFRTNCDGKTGVVRYAIERVRTHKCAPNNKEFPMHKALPRIASVVSAVFFAPMATHAHPDTQSVSGSALVQPAEIVDCTLKNGDASQCVAYTVKFLPNDLEIGPFCPTTLDDVGGVWDWDGENAGLYRIDRAYLEMLASLGYTFYDDNGEVNVFDIRVEGPDAAHECISGSLDVSADMSITALIPISPVMAGEPTALGTVAKVGMALDGVPIFADAPSILDTGHMPALDTCGGHVDPGGWYHWHATATDIDTVFTHEHVDAACENVEQDQTAKFGYAFDGFAIYGSREADGSLPENLDECGGHIGSVEGAKGEVYHYHASESFPNLPTCLRGMVAQNNFTTTAAQGIGAEGGPGAGSPGAGGPDFTAVAEALGVEVSAIEEVMEAEGGPRADLAKVAEQLGATQEALEVAMPRRP